MAEPAWQDEFLAAGYKPYRDSLKARDERGVEAGMQMYIGSAQRRYVDARGTRYFLNIDFYDFTQMHEGGRRQASAGVQFQMNDEDWDGCANISRAVISTIAETEIWFAELWHRMGWGYYEVDDPTHPPSNMGRCLPGHETVPGYGLTAPSPTPEP